MVPPFEGTELCPQETRYSRQPQHQDPPVLAATLSPEPRGTLRQGSCGSPQPSPATPTAQQLQLLTADSPAATPREGPPQTLTLGGELQECGERAPQLRADGHGAAAIHRNCCLSSAQEKGCSSRLLTQNSSLMCSFSCLSARVPQCSPTASRPCSWLWSSSKGQWWGAPELCPAAPRPRREVPALPWYRGDLPVM